MIDQEAFGSTASVARARALRRQDTKAEARLWNALRAHRLGGWKWKRQVPWGPYFLDFLCRDAALVVEVDGGQHSEQIAYDERRSAFIQRSGLTVLRFWNSEILRHRDEVCFTILRACGGEKPGFDPLPTLSLSSPRLRGGRGRGGGSAAFPPLPPRSGYGED